MPGVDLLTVVVSPRECDVLVSSYHFRGEWQSSLDQHVTAFRGINWRLKDWDQYAGTLATFHRAGVRSMLIMEYTGGAWVTVASWMKGVGIELVE